jgi:hypothetical protein
MGFPVAAPLTDLQMTLGKIMTSVLEASKTAMRSAKFATDKVQWWTAFAFDKIKWIPISALIGIIITLFKHPLEFITRVLCAIIVSILFVLYIITTIPPFSWIAFVVWFFIRYVLVMLGFTIVSFVIFAIIAVLFMVLTIFNAISGGRLNSLTLCQTSPTAWFTVPNWQDGNKYERGFFCNRPCAAGYSPDEMTGSFCNRAPFAQPSYCPQAEVMRLLLKKNKIGERHVYGNFIPSPSYFVKVPREKEEEYIKHFDQMQKFFNKCSQKVGGFNDIALDICSSLDAIKELKINVLSDDTIRKLKEVCKQGFCNSKSRHVFCGAFTDFPTENRGELVKRIIFMITALVVFLFLLMVTYKFVSASTK